MGCPAPLRPPPDREPEIRARVADRIPARHLAAAQPRLRRRPGSSALRPHPPAMAERTGQAVGALAARHPPERRLGIQVRGLDHPLRELPGLTSGRRRRSGPPGPCRAGTLPGRPAHRAGRQKGAPHPHRRAQRLLPGHRPAARDGTLPASTQFFAEDYPKDGERLPRALAEHVMAQLEHPGNLSRWDDPARRLITVILMRCGLRISDAARLPFGCIAHDAEGAPYLRYYNHKMKREALVPVDEKLQQLITEQQQRVLGRRPGGVPVLFPRPNANLDGTRPFRASTYREALYRWLERCDIRDEYGRPARFTPHQWRHTLGTRLINKDVPQEVIRKILDHDSHAMTAHYARLNDTTVRRHWEAARKVNIQGQTVTLDPDGPLADAAWAKQRLSRTTQALPNGFCGLPLVQTCPHANSCLTCPLFVTTVEFLPQHRAHRQQALQIITAAEARGQARMAEMNRQVADSLENIITTLESGHSQQPEAAADAS